MGEHALIEVHWLIKHIRISSTEKMRFQNTQRHWKSFSLSRSWCLMGLLYAGTAIREWATALSSRVLTADCPRAAGAPSRKRASCARIGNPRQRFCARCTLAGGSFQILQHPHNFRKAYARPSSAHPLCIICLLSLMDQPASEVPVGIGDRMREGHNK